MSRQSFWFPVGLAVVIIAIIVSGQVGLTGDEIHRHVTSVADVVRRIGWPVIWLAAAGRWVGTREAGLGFFALGVLPLAFAQAGWSLPFWLYPVVPVGVALAAITWARRPGEPAGGLLWVAGVTAGLTAVYHLGHMTRALRYGSTPETAAAVTTALGAHWLLVAVVAWRGGGRHLMWLAGMAGCQALVALLGVGMMLWSPLNAPGFDLLYGVLSTGVPIAAAGVVWTAASFRTTNA